MSNQLIPVVPGTIAGETIPTVNARELHAFLCVESKFQDWIKRRIEQYGFEQDVDFVAVLKTEKNVRWFGDRTITDYFLSLDMAKELAMVENNPKGREARRYFIRCERELQAQAAPALPPPAPKLYTIPYDEYVALLKDRCALLELRLVARPPRRNLSDSERAEILRLHALGWSYPSIGKAIGRGASSVETFLRTQRKRAAQAV